MSDETYDDADGFRLTVSSVKPNEEGGVVTFEFEAEGLDGLEFEIPYDGTDSLDEGVKRAARTLVEVAQALVTEAGRLAE